MKIKIKIPHRHGDGTVTYTEKELNVLKEYNNYYLVEHPERL